MHHFNNISLILLCHSILKRQPYKPLAFASCIAIQADKPPELLASRSRVQGNIVKHCQNAVLSQETYQIRSFFEIPTLHIKHVRVVLAVLWHKWQLYKSP